MNPEITHINLIDASNVPVYGGVKRILRYSFTLRANQIDHYGEVKYEIRGIEDFHPLVDSIWMKVDDVTFPDAINGSRPDLSDDEIEELLDPQSN